MQCLYPTEERYTLQCKVLAVKNFDKFYELLVVPSKFYLYLLVAFINSFLVKYIIHQNSPPPKNE